VTGYNDMPLADRLSPPLTTVRVQHHAGGRASAELMLAMLRDEQAAPGHIVLPVEIVIRGSTRTIARSMPNRSAGLIRSA
jgi:LacI family transcriptional regulator